MAENKLVTELKRLMREEGLSGQDAWAEYVLRISPAGYKGLSPEQEIRLHEDAAAALETTGAVNLRDLFSRLDAEAAERSPLAFPKRDV
jgi:hypothetical protein